MRLCLLQFCFYRTAAATGALGAQLLAAVVNGARLQLLLVSPAAATGTSAVPLGLTVTRPGHSSRALRFAVFGTLAFTMPYLHSS